MVYAGSYYLVVLPFSVPQQITQLREAMKKAEEEFTAKIQETEARAKTAEGNVFEIFMFFPHACSFISCKIARSEESGVTPTV